jgi:hypothetical protein
LTTDQKVTGLNPVGVTKLLKLVLFIIGPVAQLNRAFDYGSEGYRFESCRGHKEIPCKLQFAGDFFVLFDGMAKILRERQNKAHTEILRD